MVNDEPIAVLDAEATKLESQAAAMRSVIAMFRPTNGAPPPVAPSKRAVAAADKPARPCADMEPRRFGTEGWAKRHHGKLEVLGIASKLVRVDGMWEVRPVA